MAPKYSEEDLPIAIQLVKDGLSYRKAADKYGIPPTTLRMRCKNQQSRKEAFAPYQIISPAQEEALASWIRVQAALGFPVTHQQIRYLAQKLSDIRGNTSRVGKRWVKGFLARNDCVATQRAKRVDSSRINGATKEAIAGFYDRFEIPEIKAIKPKYKYNKDEMGLMEGQGRNGLVVGCAEYKGVIKRSPGSRTWTTFIECINAIGECLPPLVIFKGKSVQKQWFPRNLKPLEEWKFHATNNGWTDDETGLEWLHKIFLPLTKPEDPDDWRLLILDGHNSHTTAAYMWECFTHKVYLLYLPPHCSHVVQPLDLGVFSSAKQRYRSLLSESTQYSDSTIVGKRLLLKCYWLAHQEAFTPKNIKSGFRATGIWPFNRQKGLRSPLLLENTTKRSILKPTKSGVAPVTPKPKKVVFTTPGPWKTPMKAINLTIQLGQINVANKGNRMQRSLFRKVEKAFDLKDLKVAILETENEALKAELWDLKHKKKKKVELSPNSKFAGVRAVARARRGDPDIDDSFIGESEVGLVDETASRLDPCAECGGGPNVAHLA